MTHDSSQRIHRVAATGFAAKAGTYVAGRPDYPSQLDGWLRDSLALGPGRVALDLGSGTGKFLPRLLSTAAHVMAVEPVAAMRAQLVALFPQVEALDGTAEHIPADDGCVDAVVCAQSFHWFATVEAVHEIRRVLKPGGALGLVWNVRDESVDWVAALTRIVNAYEGDTPRFNSGAWRKLFPAAGFSALQETSLPYVHAGPAERVIVDRLMSVSFIGALPEAQRQKVRSDIRALIAATPALAGPGDVASPYVTQAFWCCKTR